MEVMEELRITRLVDSTFEIKDLKDGRFYAVVPSQSRAGKTFEVITDKDGVECSCECEAFRWSHGRPCKHIKALMIKIKEKEVFKNIESRVKEELEKLEKERRDFIRGG